MFINGVFYEYNICPKTCLEVSKWQQLSIAKNVLAVENARMFALLKQSKLLKEKHRSVMTVLIAVNVLMCAQCKQLRCNKEEIMPGKDGTGPLGNGSNGGGGRGRRMRGNFDYDYCICPNCGEKIKHQPGMPCTLEKCPKCQTNMIRE
jgi:hypothetical protein